MVRMLILCPYCYRDRIIKGGKTSAGQQRRQAHNAACPQHHQPGQILQAPRLPLRA